jgi:hypothetical protein
MFLDTPTLDVAVKITHVIGLPAIVGAIVWLVRAYDNSARSNKEISEGVKETQRITMETQGAVNTMQTNHLTHMAEGIKELSVTQGETVKVLTSIDTGIKVLVDRSPRKR